MTLVFHVNPETGEPGKCTAKNRCPFGEQEDHFETLSAARASYELKMRELTIVELSKKSEFLSDWRIQPWEERKAILESRILAIVEVADIAHKRRYKIEWIKDFDGNPGLLGLGGGVKARRPYIRLPELRMEKLEETAAMEDIIHEIAHVVKGSVEHDKTWQDNAKKLAITAEVVPWHDFPEGSELSPQESFRINYLWFSQRAPKFIGVCSNDSTHIFSSPTERGKTQTCVLCDDQGKDGYLTVNWGFSSDENIKNQWIFDRMSEGRT